MASCYFDLFFWRYIFVSTLLMLSHMIMLLTVDHHESHRDCSLFVKAGYCY